jgi:hypothetical protein
MSPLYVHNFCISDSNVSYVQGDQHNTYTTSGNIIQHPSCVPHMIILWCTDTDQLLRTLSPRIAANTSYVDQKKGFCYPGTRAQILADIKDWASNVSEDTPRCLWLTGVPGAGKSSITATIARDFKDSGPLWAQFFISRIHNSTTNPDNIFPSIADQLAKKCPGAKHAICDALEQTPSLVDTISDDQGEMLFLKPIQVAANLNPSKPILFVIDALDECDAEYRRITNILSKVIAKLPRNAKVLISSRPEEGIRAHLSPMLDAKYATRIDLDTSTPSSILDVAMFLREQIKEIVSNEGLEREWPGEEEMEGLCVKASGLFIWAVTATKFIRAQIDADGSECLDDVLDELNTKGMGDINALYHIILKRTCPDHDWAFERFRRIVGCILALQEPLCLVALKDLLNLRKPNTNRPADVKHFIRRLRTVLVVGTDEINDKTIPRLHKSFIEFITSEHAERFRVNMVASNQELAVQCLRQLNGLTRDMCEIEHLAAFNNDIQDLPTRIDRHFPPELRYACRCWSLHLPQEAKEKPSSRIKGAGAGAKQRRKNADNDNTMYHERSSRNTKGAAEALTERTTEGFVVPASCKLLALLQDFLNKHLLHWMEAMSLFGDRTVILLLERAARWINVRLSQPNPVLPGPTLMDL